MLCPESSIYGVQSSHGPCRLNTHFLQYIESNILTLFNITRYPTFFDDIAARLLPVIPLIIYRLIENDVIDAADRVLQVYSTFLHYYPLNFTFVRDILAYFYGHLPGKLIIRILTVLDVKKVMMALYPHIF